MNIINDGNGMSFLAFDNENLYYNIEGPEPNAEFDPSIPLTLLSADNNGGLKLHILLEHFENLGKISSPNDVVVNLKTYPYWFEILSDYENQLEYLNNRIVLLNMEIDGPDITGTFYLYLIGGPNEYELCTSDKTNLSADEIITYYGFGDCDFWNEIQANGEFISETIPGIKNGYDLHKAILNILMNVNEYFTNSGGIKWDDIIQVLMLNTNTKNIGAELKSLII
jgi:hypothetical protein